MRLLRFSYIRTRSLLVLALILTAASALFSFTAISFLGFYKTFSSYLGEEEDIVAIYDRKSDTPFTGLVSMQLAVSVQSLQGVLAASPEVIVPVIAKGESMFLRGVVPAVFAKLTKLCLLQGDQLRLEDSDSVMMGIRLAERLRMDAGEKILAFAVLAQSYVELEVKGIFESKTALDDEILAPIYVGQWMRGIDYDHVTLIRVKIERSLVSPSRIFAELSREASEPSQGDEEGDGQQGGIVTWPRALFSIEDIGVEGAARFMKIYLDNYGVTEETILILSIMVFSLAGASVISASKTLIQQHKGEIEVLRSVGASNRTIRTDLLAKVLPWSVAFSMVGTGIGILALMIFERSGHLEVLSHGISFQFDPLILVLQLIVSSLIVALGILSSLRSQV